MSVGEPDYISLRVQPIFTEHIQEPSLFLFMFVFCSAGNHLYLHRQAHILRILHILASFLHVIANLQIKLSIICNA